MIQKWFRTVLSPAFLLAMFLMIGWQATWAADDFDLSKYHSYEEITKILKAFESKDSNLARLISAGRSFQGKELWVMEISNQKVGKTEEKPAIFIAAGLEGDEVVGSEVCLYTIDYLLENYSKDERVKNLVDRKTFYVWPTINPDACDVMVKSPGQPMVQNFRPVDTDGDGMVDEDPPEDLNKDGFITKMRVKDAEGDYEISQDDPRIMVPIKKEDAKEKADRYKLYLEGIDNDKDGEYNEDGVGGVDLNHNFPSGWEMEYEQQGSGMYPGSELESDAVMRFLTDHPNVAVIVAYESGKGALFRPYYHLADKEIPKVDLKIYELFGEKYKDITGYEITHGYPEVAKKDTARGSEEEKLLKTLKEEQPGELRKRARPGGVRARTTKQGRKEKPAHGAFLDWAYSDYNVYSLSPSVWGLPTEYQTQADSIKTEIRDELGWLDFFEKEHGGKGFVPWQTYDHPQLGELEIGGWSSFYEKNPPVGERLEEVCEQHALFALDMAEMTAQIQIRRVEFNPIQVLSGATEATSAVGKEGSLEISRGTKKIASSIILAEVKINVGNDGPVGTRTALGAKTRYSLQEPRSVLAYLEEKDDNVEILSMPKVLRLGVIEGTETKDLVEKEEAKEEEKESGVQREEGEETQAKGKKKEEEEKPDLKSGTWLVKIYGGSAVLKIRVVSEKGGTVVKRVPVKL